MPAFNAVFGGCMNNPALTSTFAPIASALDMLVMGLPPKSQPPGIPARAHPALPSIAPQGQDAFSISSTEVRPLIWLVFISIVDPFSNLMAPIDESISSQIVTSLILNILNATYAFNQYCRGYDRNGGVFRPCYIDISIQRFPAVDDIFFQIMTLLSGCMLPVCLYSVFVNFF